MTQNQNLLYMAILFMNNDLIEYILSSCNVIIDAESYIKCIYSSNYDAFIILKESDRSNALKELTRIIERGVDFLQE